MSRLERLLLDAVVEGEPIHGRDVACRCVGAAYRRLSEIGHLQDVTQQILTGRRRPLLQILLLTKAIPGRAIAARRRGACRLPVRELLEVLACVARSARHR